MSNQITADGATTVIYEQTERAIEIAGLPVANYAELTGGGIQLEGRENVYNAKGEIIGTTNGIPKPQNATFKPLISTWEGVIKPALVALAASQGITGAVAYMKVDFTIVDQFQSLKLGAPSYTKRQSFRINKEVPETPADGKAFMMDIEVFPTSLPDITYN